MLFNSLAYLLFLPLATVVLYLVPGRYQWLWLLACSMFFYYTLLPLFLPVFLVLILVNFYFGLLIRKSLKKQRVFNKALVVNLVILAIFKYTGTLDSLFMALHSSREPDIFRQIILPVGMSYFIFTILSYLIELKRGNVPAEEHLGVFASALLFFPKIMQGPIERPGGIFHQFREARQFDYAGVTEGLKLMLSGYFKKLVVADRLAIYVNAVYGNSSMQSGPSLTLATFFYAVQIYADFSGYTDIALGSARIMGFRIQNNFNRPYLAVSVKDFWARWHISLSTWLRDYLFLPLAFFFSRKWKKMKYLGVATEKWIFFFASMITFGICGIWHGVGLTYLAWGILMGFYLSYANFTAGLKKRLRQKFNISKKSPPFIAYNIIITFLLVSFAFIFFRADSLKESFSIIHKILAGQGKLFIGEQDNFLYSVLAVILMAAADLRHEFFEGRYMLMHNKHLAIRFATYVISITYIGLLGVLDGGQFLYFKF